MSELTSTQIQILAITGFLSVTWGIYAVYTIKDYLRFRGQGRGTTVTYLRRVIVAFCLWLFVFSFFFRIVSVYFGVSDDVAGQVTFFSLLGSNVLGSLFAVVSLLFDD